MAAEMLHTESPSKTPSPGWPSPDTVFAPTKCLQPPDSLQLPAAKGTVLELRISLPRAAQRVVGLIAILLIAPQLGALGDLGGATLARLGGIPWGVCLAGFVAQLVDGSLGMGYGVTSSSIMSAAGLSASTASSVVHLAQLGTTLVSGIAHYRANNVEPTTTARMSGWGFCGAFGGACILARLPASGAKVVAAALLLSVGGYLLARSYRLGADNGTPAGRTPPRLNFIVPLALLAGFVDATG
jgi:hypothetical protein